MARAIGQVETVERKTMIDRTHNLPVTRQMPNPESGPLPAYYGPVPTSQEYLALIPSGIDIPAWSILNAHRWSKFGVYGQL